MTFENVMLFLAGWIAGWALIRLLGTHLVGLINAAIRDTLCFVYATKAQFRLNNGKANVMRDMPHWFLHYLDNLGKLSDKEAAMAAIVDRQLVQIARIEIARRQIATVFPYGQAD